MPGFEGIYHESTTVYETCDAILLTLLVSTADTTAQSGDGRMAALPVVASTGSQIYMK
jgi:hypothetical protein